LCGGELSVSRYGNLNPDKEPLVPTEQRSVGVEFAGSQYTDRTVSFCPTDRPVASQAGNINDNIIIPLREGHRQRVFENRVLRGMFGPKGDEVAGERRKLHSGELHNLYSSPDIVRQIKSRRMRWAGHVARMGEGRNVYSVLVGKPEGKRPLERPRRRWEDGIKMDLREIGWGGVDSPGSG
jgi:hypothetical protein